MNVLEKSDIVEQMQKALGTTSNVTAMDSNTVIKIVLAAVEEYDRQRKEKDGLMVTMATNSNRDPL